MNGCLINYKILDEKVRTLEVASNKSIEELIKLFLSGYTLTAPKNLSCKEVLK